VTPSDRAAAQAALNEGRPVYLRLDQIRGPEDAAADIIDLWKSASAAMRAMLGGSTLAGQDLMRELRQRGELNLEQANAIASFWDAQNRVTDVAYKPTLTDIGFARAGYNELTRAAADAGQGPASQPASASTFAPGGATQAAMPGPGVPVAEAAPPVAAASAISPSAIRRSRTGLLVGIVVVLVVIAGAIAAYVLNGRNKFNDELTNAISLMTTGRTEAARAAFTTLAHEYPDKAAPHVFLSRLARVDTPPDMNTARQELITAIRIQPDYAPAQREMGIFQLASRNPSLARNFLIRAVELAPDDSAAQGYLGCALMSLNRIDEAQKFLSRAGPGTWSSCKPPPSPAP
jgi:tetratricopeptide (TPR) repeat protein